MNYLTSLCASKDSKSLEILIFPKLNPSEIRDFPNEAFRSQESGSCILHPCPLKHRAKNHNWPPLSVAAQKVLFLQELVAGSHLRSSSSKHLWNCKQHTGVMEYDTNPKQGINQGEIPRNYHTFNKHCLIAPEMGPI